MKSLHIWLVLAAVGIGAWGVYTWAMIMLAAG